MSLLYSPDREPSGFILERHISINAAAQHSGYSAQYLRRLLRIRSPKGIKIGQIRLIDLESFELYLDRALMVQDRRFGPQSTTAHHMLAVA